ncbi:MAG: serine hydrolase [Patescibacteria group bacterium]|mgnify:CR=1 FL=1
MDSHYYQPKNEKVFIAAGIIGLILIVMVVLFIYSKNQYIRIDDIKTPIAETEETERVFAEGKPFDNLILTAKATVVWDVSNKKLIFQKNEKDILPLASLTKLMTALVAIELLPRQSTIRIAKEYLEEENGAGLLADERWNSDDLISLTLLTSSNVGARAIATVAGAFLPPNDKTSNPRGLFVKRLNRRAADLGLISMRYYNDGGLDIDKERGGAYGNARDVAILMDHILNNYPELLEPTKHLEREIISADKVSHNFRNTNEKAVTIPGAIGSKTGFTDLAQGNLAVAFSPGLEGPFIAVVLGSTFDGRFADMDKLVSATLKTLAQ